MSRIGKLPVKLPVGTKAEVADRVVSVTGPLGTASLKLVRNIDVAVDGEILQVSAKGNAGEMAAIFGTTRALIANMVKGVSEGWSKKLELVGTGFRAEVAGDVLKLTVGYSHPVEIKAPAGIAFKVEKLVVTVEGVDKELVGRLAANIRSVRPPEPYKGKGIKYQDEVIRRKPGKAAAKMAPGAA